MSMIKIQGRGRLALLFILLLVTAGLGAQNLYPDLSIPRSAGSIEFDTQGVEVFLESYGRPQNAILFDQVLQLSSEAIRREDTAVLQLDSLKRIQDASLGDLLSRSRPLFSLSGTPAYGFSSSQFTDFSGGFPPTSEVLSSHLFSLASKMDLSLPTGGQASLSLDAMSTYSSSGGDPWSWALSPSVSLSVSQPLFIADRMIDTGYAQALLEDATIELDGLIFQREDLIKELSLQALRLLNVYQGLKEQRYSLYLQRQLIEKELLQLQTDLETGTVSSSAFSRQKLALKQIDLSIESLSNQILSTGEDLKGFLSSEYQAVLERTLVPSEEVAGFLLQYADQALLEDRELFVMILETDSEYRSAQDQFLQAQLAQRVGSVADAPILSFSLDYSPAYDDDSTTRSLASSFTDLFSGDPSISFSVSLIASDLSRRTSRLLKTTQEESLYQASLKASSAAEAVAQYIIELQRRIDESLRAVAVGLSEYENSRDSYEDLLVRSKDGKVSQIELERSYSERLKSAFDLLASLREAELIKVELERRTGQPIQVAP